MAPNAGLRLFQSATYSGSLRVRQAIDFATVPPCVRAICGDGLRPRASRPASRPSTSMISTAPASSGKPKWNAASTAWIMSVSSISSAAGTMPAPMMSLMVLVASSTRLEDAEQRAVRLRVAGQAAPITFVTMPNVPSVPTITPVRS